MHGEATPRSSSHSGAEKKNSPDPNAHEFLWGRGKKTLKRPLFWALFSNFRNHLKTIFWPILRHETVKTHPIDGLRWFWQVFACFLTSCPASWWATRGIFPWWQKLTKKIGIILEKITSRGQVGMHGEASPRSLSHSGAEKKNSPDPNAHEFLWGRRKKTLKRPLFWALFWIFKTILKTPFDQFWGIKRSNPTQFDGLRWFWQVFAWFWTSCPCLLMGRALFLWWPKLTKKIGIIFEKITSRGQVGMHGEASPRSSSHSGAEKKNSPDPNAHEFLWGRGKKTLKRPVFWALFSNFRNHLKTIFWPILRHETVKSHAIWCIPRIPTGLCMNFDVLTCPWGALSLWSPKFTKKIWIIFEKLTSRGQVGMYWEPTPRSSSHSGAEKNNSPDPSAHEFLWGWGKKTLKRPLFWALFLNFRNHRKNTFGPILRPWNG